VVLRGQLEFRLSTSSRTRQTAAVIHVYYCTKFTKICGTDTLLSKRAYRLGRLRLCPLIHVYIYAAMERPRSPCSPCNLASLVIGYWARDQLSDLHGHDVRGLGACFCDTWPPRRYARLASHSRPRRHTHRDFPGVNCAKAHRVAARLCGSKARLASATQSLETDERPCQFLALVPGREAAATPSSLGLYTSRITTRSCPAHHLWA
jgi:hypothetical protein